PTSRTRGAAGSFPPSATRSTPGSRCSSSRRPSTSSSTRSRTVRIGSPCRSPASSACSRRPERAASAAVLEQREDPGERDADPLGAVLELVAELVDRLVEEVEVEQDLELLGAVRQERGSPR